jgi:flagellar assembly protein FliH
MANTQGAKRKFTFDTEFLGSEDRRAPAARARQKQTLTIEELDNLKTLARLEGENNAQARATEAMERTIAVLSQSVRAALEQSQSEIETVREEAAQLALAMASKIASAALAALPAAEVEAALRKAMHQAIGEPRITLRTSAQVAEVLEPAMAEIAHQEGYEGRVMVAADPGLSTGDCRIEWRGGGAERSAKRIEDALAALIAHRFSNTVKG